MFAFHSVCRRISGSIIQNFYKKKRVERVYGKGSLGQTLATLHVDVHNSFNIAQASSIKTTIWLSTFKGEIHEITNLFRLEIRRALNRKCCHYLETIDKNSFLLISF